MLSLSKQLDYALQLMIRLSKQNQGERLSLRNFSESSGISFLFLQKIARDLKSAGFIDSNRGSKGGYFLLREPKEINLREIFEIIEGPLGITECLKPSGKCPNLHRCDAQPIFKYINDSFINSIENRFLIEFV